MDVAVERSRVEGLIKWYVARCTLLDFDTSNEHSPARAREILFEFEWLVLVLRVSVCMCVT